MNTLKIHDTEHQKRLYYLDNLKVLLTCLVIAHHASQAYGPTGGEWAYHNSNGIIGWLGNFMAVNAAYFMGLFFMISGYFVPDSYQSQKAGAFVGKKLKRLMLPVVILLVAIVPIYFYFASMLHAPSRIGFSDYYINTYWKDDLISYEHGWYLINLCFYCLIYALVMKFIKGSKIKALQRFKTYYLLILAILIGVVSYFVRLVSPIDRWIDLFGFIGMEPAHVPQYVLFFLFGILAGKYGYLEAISKKTGYIMAALGAVMALMVYLSGLRFISPFMGIVWQGWAFYESFMAVFLSIGLIVVFRDFCNWTNAFQRILARSAFGAYIIHNSFVVPLQVYFDWVLVSPWVKFLCVSVLSILLSFLGAYLFLQIKSIAKRIVKQPNTLSGKKETA